MKRIWLIMVILVAAAFLNKCSVNKKSENPVGNIEKLIAGKDIVVLNFWSIFCLPCMQEIPIISSLYDEYKTAANISISSIALNSKSELSQFFSSDTLNIYGKIYRRMNKKIELPVLAYFKYDSNLDSKRNIVASNQKNDILLSYLASKFNLEGIPTTIIYFKGKEYKRFGGFGGDSFEFRKKILDAIVYLNNK